jgi:hypothetical protein
VYAKFGPHKFHLNLDGRCKVTLGFVIPGPSLLGRDQNEKFFFTTQIFLELFLCGVILGRSLFDKIPHEKVRLNFVNVLLRVGAVHYSRWDEDGEFLDKKNPPPFGRGLRFSRTRVTP